MLRALWSHWPTAAWPRRTQGHPSTPSVQNYQDGTGPYIGTAMKNVSSFTMPLVSFERSRVIGIGAFRKSGQGRSSRWCLGESVVALTRGLVGRDGRRRPQFRKSWYVAPLGRSEAQPVNPAYSTRDELIIGDDETGKRVKPACETDDDSAAATAGGWF
jgi:hypothetical protein